ncbi:hypothetical protein COLO4_23663 [Corchorus olitorius]|uniref:Uncharacterized protein n=1 Tax=Corchorus olitorius TaxID=93759 RepID=A0A1R3IFF7_9ROSI|nr:hypothetical protein COLO4_23663 [Corchorus olitorius]
MATRFGTLKMNSLAISMPELEFMHPEVSNTQLLQIGYSLA